MTELGQQYLGHLMALADCVRGHLNGGDWDKEMWEELGEVDRCRRELEKRRTERLLNRLNK
jgi:hypothetical protein